MSLSIPPEILDKIFLGIPYVCRKIRNCLHRDKAKIIGLEKEIETLKKVNIEQAQEISKLKTNINELERKTKVMDELPEDCELIHENILLNKKTGVRYCWNCWNKIEGRERRVLTGNDYAVGCNVCNISTRIRDYPRSDPPPANYGFGF